MRVGIDCRLWNESGVGRYTRNLVRYLQELDKRNDYVLFVLPQDKENIKWQMINDKWKIVTTDIRWHTTREQLIFPLILTKEKLDLVHFPYFSLPILYPGKFVVTIHDLIPLHFDTGRATTLPQPLYKLKRLGYKFVIKKAAERAVKILTVSNATKDEIVKHLRVSKSKVVVTHEGIDEQIQNPLFDSKLAQSEQSEIRNKFRNSKLEIRNYFLYVGNAYPHKNLENLIKALKILISKYPNIALVLVGKEDYFYKGLKGQVKKMEISNNIVFYGEATDSELQSLYQNAKALIIPSLMEGFGLPALEALSNKCLVLASDIPALRETCGEAAIYFNPYDVRDMTAKLKAIIVQSNSLDYRTKKARGVVKARHFSWKKMARETLKIYQSI